MANTNENVDDPGMRVVDETGKRSHIVIARNACMLLSKRTFNKLKDDPPEAMKTARALEYLLVVNPHVAGTLSKYIEDRFHTKLNLPPAFPLGRNETYDGKPVVVYNRVGLNPDADFSQKHKNLRVTLIIWEKEGKPCYSFVDAQPYEAEGMFQDGTAVLF